MNFSRITLTMALRQSTEDLDVIRQRNQQATSEISSGLRVRLPSDGPVQVPDIIDTHSAISSDAQFKSNLQGVTDQLRSVDGALSQAGDVATRALTLASQASNFNQTAQTRASIGVEVAGLVQDMITIANTSFGGKFLFAGSAETTQPFVPDSSGPSGVLYRGDTIERQAAFPGGTESPVNIDGQAIFLNAAAFTGAGRTVGTAGATTPAPPVGVGITFTNGLSGTIAADLPSFFVAAAPPTVPNTGDQVTVNFISTDNSINSSVTATMAGGENAGQIATALNAQVAANSALAGKITFSSQGGNLKIVESGTAGIGFHFTSTATGALVTGLEPGGAIGGESAAEIAAALNAQVAQNPELRSAGVVFSAANGQVAVTGNAGFTFNAIDFDRGTGFVSGLAGQHTVGGSGSADVFGTLTALENALQANDVNGIQAALTPLQAVVDHLSNVQGFYGAAQQQAQTAVNSLSQTDIVNQQRLSDLQDADVVQAATDLAQSQVNEQAALRVAAQQTGRNLFDFLA